MTNKEKIERLYELKQEWDDNKKIIDDKNKEIEDIIKELENKYISQQNKYDEYFKLYGDLDNKSIDIPKDLNNSLIPPKEEKGDK
ncbi:MAG: hypothetical protein N4A50_06205 [Vallitalea sp.]|jgi:predicted transcriptional regulator|nr:hypothetical protein [Vallitalea sp.]